MLVYTQINYCIKRRQMNREFFACSLESVGYLTSASQIAVKIRLLHSDSALFEMQ